MPKKETSTILAEFCANCGYNKKYAIRILNQKKFKLKLKPGKKVRYDTKPGSLLKNQALLIFVIVLTLILKMRARNLPTGKIVHATL